MRRVRARARAIGHLCGRTENDRNSNDYSRSKKRSPLRFRLLLFVRFFLARAIETVRSRRLLPAPLPDHARTGRNELEIDAFSIEGFPWD